MPGKETNEQFRQEWHWSSVGVKGGRGEGMKVSR
jgi:hypothetical protein